MFTKNHRLALIVLAAAFAGLIVTPLHAVSAHVFAGTLDKVDTGAKAIAVKTADGTVETAKFTEKTTVTGLKDGAKATDLVGKEGDHVIVHTVHGTARTVRWTGDKPVHATEGVVKDVGKGTKTVAVETAKGTTETFHVADHAVVGTGKETAEYTERGAKEGEHVTVYYTEEAGVKVAHFFKKIA
jgi:hypothetical protein